MNEQEKANDPAVITSERTINHEISKGLPRTRQQILKYLENLNESDYT